MKKELYELYFKMRRDHYEWNQLAYYAMEQEDEKLMAMYMGKLDCNHEHVIALERIFKEYDIRLIRRQNIFKRIWFRLTHIGW